MILPHHRCEDARDDISEIWAGDQRIGVGCAANSGDGPLGEHFDSKVSSKKTRAVGIRARTEWQHGSLVST